MGSPMSEEKKVQPAPRGDAAWRAAKEAIAKRNEAASKIARDRRHKRDDEIASQMHAAEMRERKELAKRKP
jgi:hypothetical protein